MTKIVRTAAGQMLDWDLLRVQIAAANNVAEKVEVTTAPPNPVDKRKRRARLEAAQQALQQAEASRPSSTPVPVSATVSDIQELDDNGWEN